MGRRLPPPHPARAGTRWKRSHSAPPASAPQAFIRPPRHHVAPAARRSPRGARRGAARPGPGPRGARPPPPAGMLSRKGAARSPGARMPPATLGAGWCGRGGRRWIKPPALPQAPRRAGGSQGPFLRDATAACLRPGTAEGPFSPRGLPTHGAELQPSSSLVGGDPRSARAAPSGPPEGMCVNLGIPVPLLRTAHVTDTSPSPEHPAWKPAFPEGSHGPAPAEGMLPPGRCGVEGEEQHSVKPSSTREITKAKAVHVRGMLGRLPSPASPTGLARPGTAFRGGSPAARPGPRPPPGRRISSGLGICRPPLSCHRSPRGAASLDGWQGGGGGQRTPTLPRAAAEAGEFPCNQRHPKPPRSHSGVPAGGRASLPRLRPPFPRARPGRPPRCMTGDTATAAAARPTPRGWL